MRRIDFNEFNYENDAMVCHEPKILNMDKYEPNIDIFKCAFENKTGIKEYTTHNFVGIDFNMKCLKIIKKLCVIISFESEEMYDKLKKEINFVLSMNLIE